MERRWMDRCFGNPEQATARSASFWEGVWDAIGGRIPPDYGWSLFGPGDGGVVFHARNGDGRSFTIVRREAVRDAGVLDEIDWVVGDGGVTLTCSPNTDNYHLAHYLIIQVRTCEPILPKEQAAELEPLIGLRLTPKE